MRHAGRGRSADIGLLLLAAIWGVNFTVVKVVLEELDPLALNALRFPLAAGALALAASRQPGPALPRREDLARILALGLLGNVAYQLCFIYGIDWTGAGNASLLLATTPVWTVLLSAAAGHERPTVGVVAGVVGTLMGMALVVLGRGDALTVSSETVRGDLLLIVASVLWAIYTVAGRDPVERYGALRMTTWTLWAGTPFLILLGLPSLLSTQYESVGPMTWLGVIYAGLLAIGLAYLLWYQGVERIGNNRTSVYSNLVPVAALATAWVWLGEVPTVLQGIGAAVILIGLTVARIAQSPGPSSPAPVIELSSPR